MKNRQSPRVPVTNGLKDIYALDMYSAYHAACLGHFSVFAFARLASAISVVRTALEEKQTKIPLALETLDAAIVTLTAVRTRGDDTDVWELTVEERPSILGGIEMAEQCIGTLDVALLEQTAANLLKLVSGEPQNQ